MSDESAPDAFRSQRSRPQTSRRVLVVDDNDDNRDLFVRRLRRKGFEVVAKADGPSALACLEKESFDGVILDWMMPTMSGLEVLDAIRERYTKVQLPVLMATAKRESEAIVEALAHGANDHVSKPIDFPVLIARLETQLSVKHESASSSSPVIDMREGVPPGTVLDGRYEIGEQIGEGGFAAVYRAKQLSTGQRVAFKLLLPHRLRRARADVEVARFLREMKVIAELEHPTWCDSSTPGSSRCFTTPYPCGPIPGRGPRRRRTQGRRGSRPLALVLTPLRSVSARPRTTSARCPTS